MHVNLNDFATKKYKEKKHHPILIPNFRSLAIVLLKQSKIESQFDLRRKAAKRWN